MDHGQPRQSESGLIEQLPVFGPAVARQSMREMVFAKLATQIASGILQVGDALPGERNLATAFGVSRETVRGAVQMLAARGIVGIVQGSRTRVISAEVGPLTVGVMRPQEIDRYPVEEVHAARKLIELQVAGDAAERIDDATLARLSDILHDQARMGDDAVRFMLSDREFHGTLYHACGNLLMAELMIDLYSYMIAHRRRAMRRPGAIARSLADHRRIFAGLAAHDRAATEAALSAHLDTILETTKAAITEPVTPPAG
ncbi:GntR family transcriptional regulator [Defluviimonas sp. 20V17]|uniref:GntR family transcriptional regulator n=1 Tax=Allgaiera indica TaxID=765699 RepID=A0AAN5A185_9RHOB|nr:FadR/GntR family transcriptional regulator [Allgaiera indica]KDB04794.1 GntR family transcriptional regulator [Defluviimonas sp. 20V17]GHE05091.1 GntR family transcriptional regulator [Allgaiera indica]SDX66838.1 transcriptional regulator, GntR family [Allgaiera indica]